MKWFIQLTFHLSTYTKEYLIVKAKAEALYIIIFFISMPHNYLTNSQAVFDSNI